jgi:hypothetical protein
MNVDIPNRSLAKRWGNHESLLEGGWVGVPVAFLSNYGNLIQYGGLTSAEAMFVLQLMAFKWSEEAPFPSYTTLAKRMGITDKQARRYAKAQGFTASFLLSSAKPHSPSLPTPAQGHFEFPVQSPLGSAKSSHHLGAKLDLDHPGMCLYNAG